MVRTLITLGVVSVWVSRPVLAQTPEQQHQDSLTRVWLGHRINGQALVRVRGDWGRVYLEQPFLVGDTLRYATERSAQAALPQPLTLTSIDRIEIRGSATGNGAAIGAGIGFAGGLAAGLGIAASVCNSSWGPCTNAEGGVALITVASTAGGALLGALIGAANKKWKTVYRTSTR